VRRRGRAQQQPVQPGHGLHTVSGQLIVAVGQEPQRGHLTVLGHRSQVRGPGGDQRDGVGIGGISLAALPGREHPHPRGQLGRHVDDSLPVSDQSLSQVPPDPGASLDRPHPLRPSRDGVPHRPVAIAAGGIPAAAQYPLPAVDYLDRRRRLMRVHPDDHTTHAALSVPVANADRREGNASLSRTDPS
jgi:hypothetical protein